MKSLFIAGAAAALCCEGLVVPKNSVPMLAGCKATDESCQKVQSSSLTSMAELAGLIESARACANSQSTCSVNLSLDLEVSAENTCGDNIIGYFLGPDFPANWIAEPMVVMSAAPAEGCAPTGGRYSDVAATSLCDGTAGAPMPTAPYYDKATTIAFNRAAPSVLVEGCVPGAPNTSYTITVGATYHYGQSEDDEAAPTDPVVPATAGDAEHPTADAGDASDDHASDDPAQPDDIPAPAPKAAAAKWAGFTAATIIAAAAGTAL